MRLNLHLDPAFAEQFALLEQRFRLLFENTEEFSAVVAAGLKFMQASRIDEKIALLKSNMFSEELLQATICGGQSFKMGPISYIWHRLVDRQIVVRATGHMPGAFADHNIVLPLLIEHLNAGTLKNILAPPSALLDRYRHAIVAVDGRTRTGATSRGTGFFAVPFVGGAATLYTCRHNVDPGAGIEVTGVTGADGVSYPFGSPRCHPTEDVATIPILGATPETPIFHFRDEAEVFDEVYTIGFPLVPCAEAGAVGHRGEVNGFAKLYLGGSDVILISNLVSPGNSGGPLVDRDGFVVGMSIKWLEGEWDGERARFSAALPAHLVRATF